MPRKKNQKSQGQALLEFALIITVLLMMIFLIIESARILWAWNTVQHAAREGARYAITGQSIDPCDSADLPKYTGICDGDDARVASIVNKAHESLAGLPLNESMSSLFEDDYYYQIEVFGVNDEGQIQPYFGGLPNTPVVVRAFYRVPIITPLLQPIIPSVPVFGQVTMNNESFGQLGNASQGQGVPPALPPIPTVGVTPSPTYTPSPTPSPTEGAPPDPTETPTYTPSPTPDYCGLEIEGNAIIGNDFLFVTGEIGHTATVINLNTGVTLGTGTLIDLDGHNCPGFASISLSTPFLLEHQGHTILVESADPADDFDTTVVLPAPPTETSTPTETPIPSTTPTNTPTITPSATPGEPYIYLDPDCRSSADVQFQVVGENWPTQEDVFLYWVVDGEPGSPSLVDTGPFTTFSQTWNKFSLAVDGSVDYQVWAVSSDHEAHATFTIPCIGAPTATATTNAPTATPEPADLIVVGPPELISTPPIVAYQPVQFRVTISNTGEIPVVDPFFVDIFLDPTVILTTTIPISQSNGYEGVSSLANGASQVITITAPLGFQNEPFEHNVYSMVDSLEEIMESDETNNISEVLVYDEVATAVPPTPTPTPDGAHDILGLVLRPPLPNEFGLQPLRGADVYAIDEDNPTTIFSTTSDRFTGVYQFINLPDATYTIRACGNLDGVEYVGLRTGIEVPYTFAVNIYTSTELLCQ